MKQLTLLFLVRNDQVLLAMKKRGFGVGRWNGVGGKIETGETVEQAMVRECQEEICVTPLAYQKRAEIIFHEQHQGVAADLMAHVYICTHWERVPTETEEMAPKWFNQSDIPYADMWADDKHWLPQFLAGKSLQAEFHLDHNDQLTQTSVQEIKGSY